MNWLSEFYRYVPAIVAGFAGSLLIWSAPSNRKIHFTLTATALGLICMEWEYWVAMGFPVSEVPFFLVSIFLTIIALFMGALGCFCLGICGLLLFTYVNVRYGAPFLLDYILPVFYALLIGLCRKRLKFWRPGILEVGYLEAIWLLCLNSVVIWRTIILGKWWWILGHAR